MAGNNEIAIVPDEAQIPDLTNPQEQLAQILRGGRKSGINISWWRERGSKAYGTLEEFEAAIERGELGR